jgi:hypothetical protein
MQSHPWSAKLSQILNANSRSIDFDPTRLRCRLIIEFKLQLMIERLLKVAVLVMMCSELFRFFGSVKNTKSPSLIKLPEPGDHSLPRPGRRSIRFNERPVSRAVTIFLLEVLANKHGRACYRPIGQPPDVFFSLHRIQNRSPTTYEKSSKKMQEENFRLARFYPQLGKLG